MNNVKYIAVVVSALGGVALAGGPAVEHRLVPTTGVEGDAFGHYLDANSGIIIASAFYSDSTGKGLPYERSAYLFNAITGEQVARLLVEDTAEDIYFAVEVAVQGGKAFVGAPNDLYNGVTGGSVYVFDSGTGASLGKWMPSTGQPYEAFGFYLDVNETLLVAAAPGSDNMRGAVYLLDIATGLEQARIIPPVGAPEAGHFGVELAVTSSYMFTGTAEYFNSTGWHFPVFYMFDISDAQNPVLLWELADHGYGKIVDIAIDGDRAVILTQSVGEGNGYIYVLDVVSGVIVDEFQISEDRLLYPFSSTIVLQGKLAYVGYPWEDSVLIIDIEQHVIVDQLNAGIDSEGEWVGLGLAVDGDRVIAGASIADDLGTRSGAVYVFNLGCVADFTNDGILDFFDVSAFLQLFNSQDSAGDLTSDGIWDFFDVSAFLQAFAAGCP